MPTIRELILPIGILFFCSCSEQKNEQKVQSLIYEGMSKNELILNLGQPTSIDSSSKVYDPVQKKLLEVEKWVYAKRTVLIINDTIKDPNLN